MNDFIDLKGASGASYRFRLWAEGAAHQPIAGNFALVKEEAEGFSIVGVGETLDLSLLRADLPKAAMRSVTHIYTRLNVARAIRVAEHEDLTARYKPARIKESSAHA
jgi:hypothetical protein